ncbi:MAG TPA: hypothetical protein DCS91_21525, partial [Microcoleaceae bacterium UBA11344]|nr:hypothetical protein [Microcoleaceae cyanobacterium UBA11344]
FDRSWHFALPSTKIIFGHGAWGMGHGAWGMGHWVWGIGHWALVATATSTTLSDQLTTDNSEQ